jgi:hypothetical protein
MTFCAAASRQAVAANWPPSLATDEMARNGCRRREGNPFSGNAARWVIEGSEKVAVGLEPLQDVDVVELLQVGISDFVPAAWRGHE